MPAKPTERYQHTIALMVHLTCHIVVQEVIEKEQPRPKSAKWEVKHKSRCRSNTRQCQSIITIMSISGYRKYEN